MTGSSIADSSAVLVARVFPQHHTAITLLTNLLMSRGQEELFGWLDLACGRGQIINHLDSAIPDETIRKKIHYLGFDIDNEYTRETAKHAEELGFGSSETLVGQLDHFANVVVPTRHFSFVTFTNTVHEIPPTLFGTLLLDLIARLAPDGTLYIYDMESLPDPELGAVVWDATDIRRLLTFLYKELGASTVPPMVQVWPHSSCTAWSVQLDRSKLDVDKKALVKLLPKVRAKVSAFISTLFDEKLERTIEALEVLTKYGEQTVDEQKRKVKLLYDFWSLSRLKQAK
jgi:hypothetical protein